MKQFEPTPFLDFLSSIYKDFEADKWVNQNALPFSHAKNSGLAIAGSIAISIARKKAIKKPGDIDFVTDDIEAALYFIRLLERKMLTLKSY